MEVVIPIDEGAVNLAVFITFLVVYGGILLFGVVMCTSFTVALYRGRKVLGQWPFYRIVRNLIILDAIFIVSQTVSTFPDMVRDSVGCKPSFTNITDTSTVEAWANSILLYVSMQLVDFLPNKGLVYFSLLMTLNRTAVFVYPSWRRVFDRGTILLPILSCWAWVLLLCFLSLMFSPIQRFDIDSLRYEDNGRPLVDAPAALLTLRCLDSIVPFIIAGFYVRVFYAIRASRHVLGADWLSEDRSTEDRRMLTQSLVIAAFLGLYNIATLAGGFFDRGSWVQRALGMCQLILSVLNHSVHSSLFILTNATIRSFLPTNLCFQKLKFGRIQPKPAATSDKSGH